MTVETSEIVLQQVIRFELADRGIEVDTVRVFRVEGSPAGNWGAECTNFGNADPLRAEIGMRNLLPGLLKKFRLR